MGEARLARAVKRNRKGAAHTSGWLKRETQKALNITPSSCEQRVRSAVGCKQTLWSRRSQCTSFLSDFGELKILSTSEMMSTDGQLRREMPLINFQELGGVGMGRGLGT